MYLPQVDVISTKLYRPLAEAMKSDVSQAAEQYCGGFRTAESRLVQVIHFSFRRLSMLTGTTVA